ncbi:MAG: TrkA family potassium uptake protein [Lachnospiraceae bacterium]|nr:TrkA family potassium uptake protein [Lachnospiraceae bacterium]
MRNNQSYAVFGLGRYGRVAAKELVNAGAEVLAVDINEDIVNSVIQEIPLSKCADVTDPEVIKQLGISNMDVVIISMASNLEASVMTTMLCKEAGVKTVIVKCGNEMNCKILEKVGADQIIFPEKESGLRLARQLINFGLVDLIELSKDASLIELTVRPEWEGKNLLELNLRKKYGVNVVAIVEDHEVNSYIVPEKPLKKSMRLIVIGNPEKLHKR